MPVQLTRVVLVAFVIAEAIAQTCHYNDTSDPTRRENESPQHRLLHLAAGPAGGGQRSQLLVSRHAFANVPVLITSLAVAPETFGQLRYGTLQISMGHSLRDAVSPVFAENPHGSMTNVLDVREHVWSYRRWSWTDIVLQRPFLYVPAAGNLLIEVIAVRDQQVAVTMPPLLTLNTGYDRLVSADMSTSVPPTTGATTGQAPKIQVCAERASLDYVGLGCAGSGGARPGLGLTGAAQPGQSVAFWLSNAPPSTAAVLVLGATNGAPYPLALDPIGMPECRLYVSPDLGVSLGTDALGMARYTLGIPNQTSLVASSLYGQSFVVDPMGNAAGLTASNYGRVLVGY